MNMVLGKELRGALRWSAAEEAQVRIGAVRNQVEKDNGQAQLRHSLSELDSIRQFLQDGINMCNKQFMESGTKEAMLHSALERGLSDCEDVRRKVVTVLAGSSNAQSKAATHSAATTSAEEVRNTASGGRPPSASATDRVRREELEKKAKRMMHEQQRKHFLEKENDKQETQKSQPMFGATRLYPGARQRPASATIPGMKRANSSTKMSKPVVTTENTVKPEQKEAWGTSEATEKPKAPQPVPRPVEPQKQTNTNTATAPSTTKTRPMSAPNRARSATNQPEQPSTGEQPSVSAWGRYQDWAQNVLNRVQSRRVQQQRQMMQKQREENPHPAQPPSTPLATTAMRPTPKVSVPVGAASTGLRRASSASMRPQSATTRTAPKLDAQAQALREQGNVYFQQKRYGDSADSYSKALEIETMSETLYCNRAAAYLMMSQFELALHDALKAIDIDPTHVKAHWRAAKAYLYLGNNEQARQMYTAAQKLADTPTDSDSINIELRTVEVVEKGRRCLRLREWQEAVKCAEAILEVFPPTGPCSMPWQCLRAEALINVDPPEANNALAKMCQEEPGNAEVWYLRAKSLFYTGHDAVSTSSSLGYVAKVREIDPKHARAAALQSGITEFSKLRDEGNAAYAAGRWQEAYVAYTKCLSVDPYNTSLKAIILCNRAAVCIQCERWRDALDDINQSISFNPQNAKSYTRRARIHQHQTNHDMAIKDLQVAVQIYPSAENQERLTQAVELKNNATRQKQTNAQTQFRYFFAGGGASAQRPSTAGTRRPQSAHTYTQHVQQHVQRKRTLYDTLGVERQVDERTIVKAYREAALKWHPDKWSCATEEQRNTAENTFKEISTAYNTLRDAQKRRQYDLTILV